MDDALEFGEGTADGLDGCDSTSNVGSGSGGVDGGSGDYGRVASRRRGGIGRGVRDRFVFVMALEQHGSTEHRRGKSCHESHERNSTEEHDGDDVDVEEPEEIDLEKKCFEEERRPARAKGLKATCAG